MSDKKQIKIKKRNIVLRVFAWIFSVIFLLSSLGWLFVTPLVSIFYLIAGLIINPPFYIWIKNKFAGWLNKWIGIIIAFTCLIIGGIVSGDSLPELEPLDKVDKINIEKKNNQTSKEDTTTKEQDSDLQTQEKESIPREYVSALKQADTYANTMNMSKKGLYDQLTSKFGGQFSEEAAQYAIDNVETDWNKNALEKAKIYQNQMNMSPSAIHDQLTSNFGDKFTKTEADYAIENLEK